MDRAFENKTVVLGVSGGIASYKACDLVRRLRERGATVQAILTRGARHFITPMTMQTLTERPVGTELFDLTRENEIGHIALARMADVLVMAPATADLIARLAIGRADDLLTTVALACTAPLVIAPAMNVRMWQHAATQENLRTLVQRGAHVVQPGEGSMACGEFGPGRLAEIPDLIAGIAEALTRPSLRGVRVLVTAGPTREKVDPVRYLTNRSSGKMGYAIAEIARRRGAEVVLVSGPVALESPAGVRVIRVESASEMHRAVMEELDRADVVIKSAAVSDFRPADASAQKLKRREADHPSIELATNPDILAEVGRKKGERVIVGFAAETHDLEKYAEQKLREKNLDLLVANDVSSADVGFDVDQNEALLFHAGGRVEKTGKVSKQQVAEQILDAVESLLPAPLRPGQQLPA